MRKGLNMDLAEIYEAIGQRMLTDFDHFQTQIKHSGDRGSEREAALKAFLMQYMPTKYSIGSGQIVDTEGNISHQCDIVIYDNFNCPLLLVGENAQIFTAESVYGVIEVKSVLNKTELINSCENISSVKRLIRKKNGPIAGIIFAYRSSYREMPIEKTASLLQKYNREIPHTQYIDLLGILDSGVIAFETVSEGLRSVYNMKTEDRCFLAYLQLETPVLLYFFWSLLELLFDQITQFPLYIHYSKSPSIGLVQKYWATDIQRGKNSTDVFPYRLSKK